MDARQSKSFTGFVFAFVCIVALGFGVLVWAGLQNQKVPPVDPVEDSSELLANPD